MTTRQELFSPANAFIQGRTARQQYDAGQTRNALAQMELDNMPREIASRNALMDMQVQAQQQALSKEQAQFAHARLRQAADSGNPKAFVLQHVPDLAAKLSQQGIDLQSMDDQSAAQLVDNLARKYAGEAGITPTDPIQSQSVGGMTVLTQGGKYLNAMSPKAADASFTLSPGQRRYEGGKLVASAPEASTRNDERLVQIADEQGNPKWVRESDAVDKAAYVARDKPAAADLKYQRELKSKMPRLQAAERRVDRLAEATKALANMPLSLNGGPLDQYAIYWTKTAQELKQAAASLTPELTALTRVPGIGSQSDLETRLAGLQFPSTEFAPEVNAKAVAELQAFMKDLGDVYGGALESGEATQSSAVASPQAPAQAPAQEITATGPNGQKVVLRNGQWVPL